MDLFVINRYLPEEEKSTDVSNADLLRDKLLKKIEERKRKHSSIVEPSPVDDDEGVVRDVENEESSLPVKRKRKKKKKQVEDNIPVVEEKTPSNFVVLGKDEKGRSEKARRVLPHWLNNPSVVSVDLKNLADTVQSIPSLDPKLVEILEKNNISHFFPVQAQVIPWLLTTLTWPSTYWPSDVCVSAPTGSGKTLAFVLPVVQALQHHPTSKIRALVVLPVQDLAKQVFKVFQTYAAHTRLKTILLSSEKPFQLEQKHLFKDDKILGERCLVDIVVTTPGRLVDHLKSTPAFNLKDLRYLIIDEADRVMEGVQNDWLYHLNTHLGLHSGSSNSFQVPPLCLRALKMELRPPQKLLFSATLSQDPEKLQQLGLFQPKLFTSVVKKTSNSMQADEGEAPEDMDENKGEFAGKFTTPAELTEAYAVCTPESKPVVLFHLIKQKKWTNILVFTASCDGCHRLARLLKALGQGKLKVSEISAKVSPQNRKKRLAKFASGKLDILVSSDALARGIDIPNVQIVISYDAPSYIKNHVHRIGRTGRAGQEGTAVTLLLQKQVKHFKDMMASARKSSIDELEVDEEELEQYSETYKTALAAVKKNLEIQKAHKNSRMIRSKKVMLHKYKKKGALSKISKKKIADKSE